MNAKVQTSTDKPADKPKVAAPVYNAFVGTALLREIRLVKSDFVLNADGLPGAESWQHVQSCEIQGSHYDAERELLFMFVAAEAHAIQKRKRVLSVKCRYVIVYGVEGKPDEAAVDAFAVRVARFAAYPYFRAHFAELMSQAGIHVPPLPVLKEQRRPIPQLNPPAKADDQSERPAKT